MQGIRLRIFSKDICSITKELSRSKWLDRLHHHFPLLLPTPSPLYLPFLVLTYNQNPARESTFSLLIMVYILTSEGKCSTRQRVGTTWGGKNERTEAGPDLEIYVYILRALDRGNRQCDKCLSCNHSARA